MSVEIQEKPKEIKGFRPEASDKKKIDAKQAKYLRDRDRELVRGKFIFHECPGGVLSFPFRMYKEDPLEVYHMRDGEVSSIPLGVARHLNKNCYIPQYEYIPGDKETNQAFVGGKGMQVTHKVRRCSFQSLEFIDSEDLSPEVGNITPVELM
jgi:hypothetical protein